MGVVTGKGLSDLIRERFGVEAHLLPPDRASPDELRQHPGRVRRHRRGRGDLRHPALRQRARWPRFFVWAIVLRASYRTVEKVFLVACVFYVSYIFAGVVQPSAGRRGPAGDRRPALPARLRIHRDAHRAGRHDHRPVDAVLPAGLGGGEEHPRGGLRTLAARHDRRLRRGHDRGRLHRGGLLVPPPRARRPDRERGRRGAGPRAARRALRLLALRLRPAQRLDLRGEHPAALDLVHHLRGARAGSRGSTRTSTRRGSSTSSTRR